MDTVQRARDDEQRLGLEIRRTILDDVVELVRALVQGAEHLAALYADELAPDAHDGATTDDERAVAAQWERLGMWFDAVRSASEWADVARGERVKLSIDDATVLVALKDEDVALINRADEVTEELASLQRIVGIFAGMLLAEARPDAVSVSSGRLVIAGVDVLPDPESRPILPGHVGVLRDRALAEAAERRAARAAE
jgi:hypothetical protein